MSVVALLVAGAVLGTVIGMLGGGGGVLAVPMLVALGEPVLSASTMSLVVVGTGAAAALVPHQRARRVDWRTGIVFGALGVVGAVLGARVSGLLAPNLLLLGFSVLVLLGALAMLRAGRRSRAEHRLLDEADLLLPEAAGSIRGSVSASDDASPRLRITARVVLLASGVGLVTGLFGVGAGFVVVPALVAALHVPIKRATATALVVIVINSAVALVAKLDHLRDIPSTLKLALVTAVFAVMGAVLSRRVPAWVLSMAFGTLLLGVAVYTVVRALTL